MRHVFAFVTVLVLVGPGWAQGQCSAVWAKANALLVGVTTHDASRPALVRQTADGGCRTSGLRFEPDSAFSITVDSLRWRGGGMDRFVEDGLPPMSLDMTLEGVRFLPRMPTPSLRYLTEIQSRGSKIDASLSAVWDQSTNELRLNSVRINLPSDDYILIEATVEGVDLTSRQTIETSMGRFAVTSQRLVVRSERAFQTYALVPLGSVLLKNSENPQAKVDVLKKEARDWIAQIPSTPLKPGTKQALLSLIDDMPEPSGILVIDQVANPGIGPARFLPLALSGMPDQGVPALIEALLDGVEISITYDKL